MNTTSREKLQAIENGEIPLVSMSNGGKLLPSSKKLLDAKLEAVRPALGLARKSIRQSRCISAKTLAWQASSKFQNR